MLKLCSVKVYNGVTFCILAIELLREVQTVIHSSFRLQLICIVRFFSFYIDLFANVFIAL